MGFNEVNISLKVAFDGEYTQTEFLPLLANDLIQGLRMDIRFIICP